MKRDTLSLVVLCALLAGVLVWQSGGIKLPSIVAPAAKVTAVVYVYEKDEGSVPPAVLAALDRLNRQGVVATAFEEDTVDGSGETPEQYKIALADARKAGLPALVVLAGDRFVRVVKSPKTEEEVLEAAK